MTILTKLCSTLSNIQKVFTSLLSDSEYKKDFSQARIAAAEQHEYTLSEHMKAQQNLDISAPSFRQRKINYFVLILAVVYHACQGAQNICHLSSPAFLKKYQELMGELPNPSVLSLHINSIKRALSRPQSEVVVDAFLFYLQEEIMALNIDTDEHIHQLFQLLINDLGIPTAIDGSYVATVGNKHGAKLHAMFDFSLNNLLGFIISDGHANERTHALDMILEQVNEQSKKLLVLADAGYLSFDLMDRITEAGCFYLVKGRKNTSCNRATVELAINEKGERIRDFEGKTLKECDKQANYGHTIDFIMKDAKGKEYRVIRTTRPKDHVNKKNTSEYVYFLTNIPLETYSGLFLSTLYHFRWTIENLFKDLKSGNGLHKSTFKNPFTIRVLIKASLASFLFKHFLASAAEKETNTIGTHSIHKIMRYDGFPVHEILYFALNNSQKKSIHKKLENQSFYKKLIKFLSFCKSGTASQHTKKVLKDLPTLADNLLKNREEYPLILEKIKAQLTPEQRGLLVKKYGSSSLIA